jgi:hypothetical protein
MWVALMKARIKWVEDRMFIGESGKVERAIALSVEKYCSASAMIAKTATITHDFELVDTTARPA